MTDECPYCHQQRLLDEELGYSEQLPDGMEVCVQADPGVYSDLHVEIDTEILGRSYYADFDIPIKFCPMCGRDLRGGEAG